MAPSFRRASMARTGCDHNRLPGRTASFQSRSSPLVPLLPLVPPDPLVPLVPLVPVADPCLEHGADRLGTHRAPVADMTLAQADAAGLLVAIAAHPEVGDLLQLSIADLGLHPLRPGVDLDPEALAAEEIRLFLHVFKVFVR